MSLPLTLLTISVLPFAMAFSYFYVLDNKLALVLPKSLVKSSYTQLVDDDGIAVADVPLPTEFQPVLSLRIRATIIKGMLLPFMLPLFVVFWAEYTINQGVLPNILFGAGDQDKSRLREAYVYYQCLY